MENMPDISELKRLSIAERILIVLELWDSIAAEQEKLGIPDNQREALDRRIADYNFSPDEGYSWREVKDIVEKTK